MFHILFLLTVCAAGNGGVCGGGESAVYDFLVFNYALYSLLQCLVCGLVVGWGYGGRLCPASQEHFNFKSVTRAARGNGAFLCIFFYFIFRVEVREDAES